MTHAVLYGYLAGWIMTSIALTLAGRKLHSQTWGSHLVAVAAGVIWPLIVAPKLSM